MGKLALVFPGQGSQSVGMGSDLAARHKAAAEVFHRAGEVLGWHAAEACFNGPEEKLNLTEFAQPALYVTSMAAMAVLRESGVTGDTVCGHSLGEYSALAAAGAMSFEEGLRLVAARGEAMGRAARDMHGSMAAIIGLEDGRVEEICRQYGKVWPVNYNSPGQLVISGEADSVHRAMEAAESAGARKVVELTVSGSFHSPLMKGAADVMEGELAKVEFKDPAPPFLSPTSCEYEQAGGLAGLLVRQMVSPVKWRQAVERLAADGVDIFIEVGNGKVLCGLIRRIIKDVKAINISDQDSLERALATVKSR